MPRKIVREVLGLYKAKTSPSSLVDRAAEGEDFVIMKSGRPMARLAPIEDTKALRVPGRGKGQWRVARKFDAPLPDEVLEAFEGGA